MHGGWRAEIPLLANDLMGLSRIGHPAQHKFLCAGGLVLVECQLNALDILRLIEDRFNVAPLTLRDTNADNMMEFFNFSGAPPLLTPPTLPPQSTNGNCQQSDEKAPGF